MESPQTSTLSHGYRIILCSKEIPVSDKSPIFTITTNMPTLLGLLLNELVETHLQTADHAVDLYQEFEHSVRLESSENQTTDSIQRVCWRIDYYGRGYLMKFLSCNKRFTKAMNALSAFHSAYGDQPAVSRITAALTESWLRRFQLYRKTRRVLHKLLKNMNLRREQLRMWVVPKATEASCIQAFERKITIDHLAIGKLAGPDTVWYNYLQYPPSAHLNDIPNISDIDKDYAGRALLSMDVSNLAQMDPSNVLVVKSCEDDKNDIVKDLDAGHEEASNSEVKSPATREPIATVAIPAINTDDPKSITRRLPLPLCFWVMALMVISTTVSVLKMLSTLLPPLWPTLCMLGLLCLLSAWKLQGEARVDPPTKESLIVLATSGPESVISVEEPAPTSMGTARLLISTSGESNQLSSTSLTTPTFTRPSKMLEAQAMANKFNDNCAEASFRLSQISITDTTPPGRLQQFSKQLYQILNMSARMHRSLNQMARDNSHCITLDSLSGMRDELACISASRDTLEEAVYMSLDALLQSSATQPGLITPVEVLDNDCSVLDDVDEGIVTSAASVDVPPYLSIGHEEEIRVTFGEDKLASDEHEGLDFALDAETPAAQLSDMVSSPVTNFEDLCSKLSIAVGDLKITATKTHTTMLSSAGENLKWPNTSFSKKGDPALYNLNRLLLLLTDTTSISELQMMKAMRSFPMDMGFMLAMVRMLMTLYLLFSGSVHGPGNKTL